MTDARLAELAPPAAAGRSLPAPSPASPRRSPRGCNCEFAE